MRQSFLILVGWAALASPLASGGERFESAALVDRFDFAGVKDREGRLLFDTETAQGNSAAPPSLNVLKSS